MLVRASALGLVALLLVTGGQQSAFAFGDTTATAQNCGMAAGGDVKNNTVNCNFGVTPEQLKAAMDGATDKIEEISERLGITRQAAKTLLRIVGERTDVPDDRLAEVLTKVANDYNRLQAQVAALNPANPTARGLVERAKAEITAGHFADAHQLLAHARLAQLAAAQEARKLREQAQATEDAELVEAAASTATEGDLAMTELHYVQAADLFKQAATVVPPGHPDERGKYLNRQAEALYRQGDERGDNAALQQAIAVCAQVLQEQSRERVPLAWAAAQENLGAALHSLGERESGTARLEEAVAAYRTALQKQTRDRVPLDWAGTQMNLGNALFRLGERESGTARMEEAVTAYRAALQEQTRDRVPLDWAMTQMNLGAALMGLGERESGTARLEEAVAAYTAALQERTRDRVPSAWAGTQTNLGTALLRLGEREGGTARLEEAVAAYRAALQEEPRERLALAWALTQTNLGAALGRLGERESGTSRLEEAVAAYRAALQERTRDRVPLDWAATQTDLGLALSRLWNGRAGRRGWRRASPRSGRRWGNRRASGCRLSGQ